MPQYRNPFEKGDLYIKFDVQFPENNWINPDKLSVSVFQFLMQLMWLSILLPLTPASFLCASFLFVLLLYRTSACAPGWPRTHSWQFLCLSLLIAEIIDVTNHSQLF